MKTKRKWEEMFFYFVCFLLFCSIFYVFLMCVCYTNVSRVWMPSAHSSKYFISYVSVIVCKLDSGPDQAKPRQSVLNFQHTNFRMCNFSREILSSSPRLFLNYYWSVWIALRWMHAKHFIHNKHNSIIRNPCEKAQLCLSPDSILII